VCIYSDPQTYIVCVHKCTCVCVHKCTCVCVHKCTCKVQPIAFGVSFNLNLQSQSHSSLLNETWQKRPNELNHSLGFETEEITHQMQQAANSDLLIYMRVYIYRSICIYRICACACANIMDCSVCMCTLIYTDLRVYIVCTHTYIHIYIYTYIHIYIVRYMYTCIHIYMYTYIYCTKYCTIYVCMCTYTHIYIYTCI